MFPLGGEKGVLLTHLLVKMLIKVNQQLNNLTCKEQFKNKSTNPQNPSFLGWETVKLPKMIRKRCSVSSNTFFELNSDMIHTDLIKK